MASSPVTLHLDVEPRRRRMYTKIEEKDDERRRRFCNKRESTRSQIFGLCANRVVMLSKEVVVHKKMIVL